MFVLYFRENTTSESASQSQRSEVSSSAANFLLSMMAVSSEGSAISSHNESSKVSNLSGTYMGDYQNGSEGANSSERESISPYRSTTEEVIWIIVYKYFFFTNPEIFMKFYI